MPDPTTPRLLQLATMRGLGALDDRAYEHAVRRALDGAAPASRYDCDERCIHADADSAAEVAHAPAPTIGAVVHYVSYGTPGGEYRSECRAAIITEARDSSDTVGLFVANPTGVFLNRGVPHRELPPADKIVAGERGEHEGGTWHWPCDA